MLKKLYFHIQPHLHEEETVEEVERSQHPQANGYNTGKKRAEPGSFALSQYVDDQRVLVMRLFPAFNGDVPSRAQFVRHRLGKRLIIRDVRIGHAVENEQGTLHLIVLSDNPYPGTHLVHHLLQLPLPLAQQRITIIITNQLCINGPGYGQLEPERRANTPAPRTVLHNPGLVGGGGVVHWLVDL